MAARAFDLAVLGGGITGISAALHARHLLGPTARITLIDRAPRLGGWIKSERVSVPPASSPSSPSSVLLECGPRTLRPVGLPGAATVALVHSLGLSDAMVSVPRDSASARNRSVLLHDTVHALPTSLSAVLRATINPKSPMYGIVPAIIRDLVHGPSLAAERAQSHASGNHGDVSLDTLLSSRFSPAVVNQLVSAIVHGIYAGNPASLSARATFTTLDRAEQAGGGSIVRGLLRLLVRGRNERAAAEAATIERQVVAGTTDQDGVRRAWDRVKGASIYSVQGGLEAIVRAAASKLEADGIDVRLNAAIEGITEGNVNGVPHTIRFQDASAVTARHIIAALPTPALHGMLSSPSPALTELATTTPAVNVAVTNIVFRTADLPAAVLARTNGFGLLSPRNKGPATDPHLLGIIYDSAAVRGLAEPEFTKFTVMMGGHYWSQGPVPTEAEAARRAVASARRHLCIPEWSRAEPVVVRSSVLGSCIPQYAPGHCERVATVREQEGARRIWVAGAWFDGVGVNDCVLSGRNAAAAIVAVS
ncbi:hypothetical protein BC828DRAFT_404095 [Blastocladiella britannica]|nr:hypothetical protein BC828DRAFT_404095 [Blastocladiella britannica]